MEFAGRERELALLDNRLAEVKRSGRGALIAMRGRRRVGKSRLVEEFAQASGCPCVFYTAVQEEGEIELRRFTRTIERSGTSRAADIASGLRPENWETALALAVEGATKARPLILVIDEFPYLATKEPSVEAVLQMVWDRTFQSAPVLIVLIGSDEAMMAALTDQGRPLYDRARAMTIEPLSPADVGELLGLEPADALDAYLAIGGFPVLALEWGRGRKLASYLRDALDDPTSFLVVSAERALSAEFPTEAQARTVLGALGDGARAHSRILGHTNLSATTVNEALHLLAGRRVVRRRTPYSARAAPKTAIWEVVDPYMRFWLRFVNRKVDLIERGRGSLLVEEFRRDWPSFRGRAIEPVVRDSLERLLPDRQRFGAARHAGGYWNRTGTIEVDLVGGDSRPVAKRVAFLGSIKWRERGRFTRRDAQEMAKWRAQVPGADEQTLLIGVSSRGFDPDVPLDRRLLPEDLLDAWRGDG
jgi:AAA+ ATPase superfamily predicted ATPase